MGKEKEKDDDDDQGKEPEIVIVTDDEKNLEVAPTGPETDDVDVPRPKPKAKEADDDQDDQDEEEESRLGASEEMEREQEAKDKQKSTHKSRRQRQKDAERRLRTERDFLERRNETLEKEVQGLKKRMDGTDKSTLKDRIAYTKTQIAKAEKIHSEATTAGKGEEATEALKIRDNLRDSLGKMEERYEALEKDEREPVQPQNPAVAVNARQWMSRTTWFDPSLRDQDSKIVRALDIAVEEAGFDPATPEYFEELDRRIAEILPHRAGKKPKKRQAEQEDEDVEDLDDEDEQEETPRRKSAKPNGKKPAGGPRFRTGGPGRELRDNEVYLTPERIAALKEAGAWDDPQLRQKYLKKYKQWDEEHADEVRR